MIVGFEDSLPPFFAGYICESNVTPFIHPSTFLHTNCSTKEAIPIALPQYHFQIIIMHGVLEHLPSFVDMLHFDQDVCF